MSTALTLSGKRVLVTGSSGGIGKAIALELGQNQGCNVLVHYHERAEGAADTVEAIQRAGGRCAGALQADFRDASDIHRLVRQIDDIWPEGWDILVNNAGIVAKLALEDDTEDLKLWHECLAVNLHAPRLLSQLCVPRMQQRIQSRQQQSEDTPVDGGVIINVSSIHSEKSNEFMGAYAASKAALDSLTRTLAMEYAVHNIRVNAIAPGVVPVERTHAAFFLPDGALSPAAKTWQSHIPLRALGTVEQVAHAVTPLLTNDWVTGAVWQVDGGMMARSNMPPRARPLL
jgi:glucose 1-dehydrogenase